jgi:hypothetical protein
MWLAWGVWWAFLAVLLFGLAALGKWHDDYYERRQWPRMHQHYWVRGPPEDNGVIIEECSCMSFRIVEGEPNG